MKLYRLCKAKYASEAFSGLGSERYGGRWNSKGTPLIYCSQNLATAQLEMLANTQKATLFQHYVYFEFELPDKLIVQLSDVDYPANWQAQPPEAESRAIGNAFFRSKQALGLLVRSVVSPVDYNCLLNPLHADFVELLPPPAPQPFVFDKRL